MNRRLLILLVLAAGSAGALAPRLRPDQVLISYQAKTPAGELSGVAHTLEWRFTALTADSAQVRVRVPLEAFDSGHPDFDALVRRALGAEANPFVEIEGVARKDRFEGTLALRGVVRPVSIAIGSVREDENLFVNASFTVDLREYGVSIPGVEPRVLVEFVGCLAATPGAVLAGGFVQPQAR